MNKRGAGRSLVTRVCQAEGVDAESADVARLVVSELVTNSIIHGCTEVEVHLSVTPDALLGEVADHGAAMLRLLEATLGAERGRGLAIVAATTSGWGIDVRPHSKAVWFKLPSWHRHSRRSPTAVGM